MCLRNGNITNDDWKLLLTRLPQNVTNIQAFSNAVRLFYDKASVASYNFASLHQLGTPVASINAVHSGAAAAAAQSEDAGSLEPLSSLRVVRFVMLTANFWPEVGLCNGAAGTVLSILYADRHRPPSLPIAVIVEFRKYNGPLICLINPAQSQYHQ